MNIFRLERIFLISRAIVIGLLPFFLFACQSKKQEDKEENKAQVEQKISDLSLGGLHGPVKQVVEKTYAGPIEVLNDQPDYITRSTYLPDGNLDETVASTADHQIVNFKYHYAADSAIATQLLIDGDSIRSRQQFVYLMAPNGARKQMQAFSAEGKPLFTSYYRASESGLPLSETNQVHRKALWKEMPCKIERQFNEQGGLEQEVWYGFDTETSTCRPTGTVRHYKNDSLQNPIEEWIIKNESQELGRFFYKYKYDDRGNWREKTRLQPMRGDTVITQVVLRSFYYY